jgi:superfamily I DNA/RNA helicase
VWSHCRECGPAPAIALVRAPNMEREADEIARRILEQAAAGRPFREMAIIVRAAKLTCRCCGRRWTRFGIPARFYFDENLDRACRHPLPHLRGGRHAGRLGLRATLAALRLAPRFADSNALDRFDFAVREQIPNAGLEG